MSVRPPCQPRQLQSSDIGLDCTHDCELDRHAGCWVVSSSGEGERRRFFERKEEIVGSGRRWRQSSDESFVLARPRHFDQSQPLLQSKPSRGSRS